MKRTIRSASGRLYQVERRLALETPWPYAWWLEQLTDVLRSGWVSLTDGPEALERFGRACAAANVAPTDMVMSLARVAEAGRARDLVDSWSRGVDVSSSPVYDAGMNGTQTKTTFHDYIDVLSEAGMSAPDTFDEGWAEWSGQRRVAPAWLIERFEGALPVNGGWVVANCGEGELTVCRVSDSGVVHARVSFSSDRGMLSHLDAAAVTAVVKAWGSM